MSLVILKVDRDKNIHSVYCDGITFSSERVVKTDSNKIAQVELPGCSILMGTTGYAEFTRYFRLYFEKHFVEANIIQYIGCDIFLERLNDIVYDIWKSFCERHRISVSNTDFNDFGCVISFNGHIYCINSIRCEDVNTFHTYDITDRNYCVCGQEEVAALCLLENEVGIQRIFDTISKFNTNINNNVGSIENVSWH
jgi:hypothetical protein